MAPWAIYTTTQKGTNLDELYGDLSFIVYLLHWPILKVINTNAGSSIQRVFAIGEALSVILILSVVIRQGFDHPINKLRSAWVARRFARRARGIDDRGGTIRAQAALKR